MNNTIAPSQDLDVFHPKTGELLKISAEKTPAPIPTPIRMIVDGYKDRPPVFLWDADWSEWNGRANAIYISSPDAILKHVNSCDCAECVRVRNLPMDEYICRLWLHELAHSTGAAKRLNRVMAAFGGFGPLMVLEEVIAETTANRIMRHLGILTPGIDGLSKAYVDYYIEKLAINTGLQNATETVKKWTEPYIDEAFKFLTQKSNFSTDFTFTVSKNRNGFKVGRPLTIPVT